MSNLDGRGLVFSLDGDGDDGRRRQPTARPGRQPLRPPRLPPPRQVNPLMLRFLFNKRLHNSDVSAAGRIVIPKEPAEMHLPTLSEKRGFWMYLYDFSSESVWAVKYRFWPNNRSKMYVFENTRDFVRAHGLVAGDSIEVFKDEEHGSFVLRGIKNIVYANHVASSSQHDDTFENLMGVDWGSSYSFAETEPDCSLDFSFIFDLNGR